MNSSCRFGLFLDGSVFKGALPFIGAIGTFCFFSWPTEMNNFNHIQTTPQCKQYLYAVLSITSRNTFFF